MPSNNREKLRQLLQKTCSQSELELYLKGLEKMDDEEVKKTLSDLKHAINTAADIAKHVEEVLKRRATKDKFQK